MNKEKIEQFKQDTPPGILKQFKDDNDIWDYINTQGRWERTIPMPKSINANSKEEASKILVENLRKAFGDDVGINIMDKEE